MNGWLAIIYFIKQGYDPAYINHFTVTNLVAGIFKSAGVLSMAVSDCCNRIPVGIRRYHYHDNVIWLLDTQISTGRVRFGRYCLSGVFVAAGTGLHCSEGY